MAEGIFEVTVETHFASAHQLRGYRGKCENLHGHNWQVELSIASDRLDELGMVADFHEIRDVLGQVLDRLDHRNLNEVEPFQTANPTCEQIARYIYESVRELCQDRSYQVSRVRVWESPGSSVTYRMAP